MARYKYPSSSPGPEWSGSLQSYSPESSTSSRRRRRSSTKSPSGPIRRSRSRRLSSNNTSDASRRISAGSRKTSDGSRMSMSTSSALSHRSPSKVTKNTSNRKSRRRSSRKIKEAPELDPEDFDGEIARCKALIKKGKQVGLHQDRLRILQAYKKEKLYCIEEKISWSFLHDRNETGVFKSLKEFLVETGDENKVMPNINAIMKAYKSGKLEWNPGYNTFWSYGKQLTQPREFDWDEFIYWNYHNEGSKGFWVEGLHGTASHTRRFWKRTVCWPSRYTDSRADAVYVKVPICLRLPGPPPLGSGLADFRTTVDPNRPTERYPPEHITTVPRDLITSVALEDDDHEQGPERETWNYGEVPVDRETIRYTRGNEQYSVLWMNDDTGADVCTITRADLANLQEHSANIRMPVTHVPLLGYVRVQGATGPSRFEEVRAIEINLANSKGKGPPMIKGQWEIIEVAIAPNPENPTDEPVRLVGPWLRHRFFTATAPDRTGRLWILKKHRRFANVGSLLHSVKFDDSGLLPVKTMFI